MAVQQEQREDLDELDELSQTVKSNSLCALGQTSSNPITSTLTHFRDEYIAHIVDKKCPAHICKNLMQYHIAKEKCIGCGICAKKCPLNAIKMYEKDIDPKKILPELINNGAEILELHVTGNDENDLDKKWQIINECCPEFASICIDRETFGNKGLLSRISKLLETRKAYTTIIQADGIPMSGSEDDFKTTLQAAATAEIVQNANFPAYLVVSGGTNSKTAELCKLCNIYPSGIAIGSWARKIVNPVISKPDFWENTELKKESVKIASELFLKTFG